jgi:hypothetical protein
LDLLLKIEPQDIFGIKGNSRCIEIYWEQKYLKDLNGKFNISS